MPGKRIQIDDETWQQLTLLGHDQMKDFQELAEEAFRDLLKKYGRPVDLKDALPPIGPSHAQKAAAEDSNAMLPPIVPSYSSPAGTAQPRSRSAGAFCCGSFGRPWFY
jgi:hypothetical protein